MGFAVLNIFDWSTTRSILFQPHYVKSCKLFCFLFIVLLHINMELGKKASDRWADDDQRSLFHIRQQTNLPNLRVDTQKTMG